VLLNDTLMSPPDQRSPAQDADSRLLRFNLRVQWTRGVLYILSFPMAMAAAEVGMLELEPREAILLTSIGVATAVAIYWMYKLGIARRLNFDPLLVWETVDIFLITATVHITGGVTSLWYIFYLSNAAAAALAGGLRAAYTVFGLNALAYLGSLYATGDIEPFDPAFYRCLFRMAFLFAASSFFFHGIAALKSKWTVIRRFADEEKQRVAELTRLTEELDARTRELAAANRRIRDADRMKSQFLANMSHELRTPMNSIIGFSEILSERLAGKIEDRHMKFLDNIHNSGSHLLGIINDILDLSKIEAGRMELFPERFPVAPVVEGVCAVMRATAAKKEITFALDVSQELPPIDADPAKFKQILYNLVSNSVKFSPNGSVVRIEARALPASESADGVETLQIFVIDEGIGIPIEAQDAMFTEFHQVSSGSRREHSGTGLGLALVKKFVELQGGSVGFTSQPGIGSTFWFILPFEFRGARESEAAATPERRENCVLVVEDDPAAWQEMEKTLANAGFVAVHARNGEEALRLTRAVEPVAITLDLVLPGMSGWHLLRALQADPATRDIPVVIVSVIAHDELGVALGARDYLVKPFDPQRLVERLTELTARRRAL
jgi:signal transduction histidine kinase/ActR/RegA family two-component response regulator